MNPEKPTQPKIESIPIEQIRVINPRFRDKHKFSTIVESIHRIGFKRPITVSRRRVEEGEPDGYDLVCGQGRLEAFQAWGETMIPAIIVEVSREDRLLMSLIENMARRHVSGISHLRNVVQLKQQGYSHAEIGRKIGLSSPYVGHLLRLVNKGEERLLDAVLKDKLPVSVAVEIADMAEGDTQVELLEIYSQKKLRKGAFLTLKRILEQRKLHGKSLKNRSLPRPKVVPSAEALIVDFQRETQKQKGLLQRAKVCETRFYLIVAAMKHLLVDEHFVTLLRAEDLMTLPIQLDTHLH